MERTLQHESQWREGLSLVGRGLWMMVRAMGRGLLRGLVFCIWWVVMLVEETDWVWVLKHAGLLIAGSLGGALFIYLLMAYSWLLL